MNGVLIVDKPQGLTSFDIVRQVRRMCNTRRVGHAGTLDPLATGVLPVAIGWATRLVEYMMAGDKTYQATMKLGAFTDTQDSEGQILEEKEWRHVDRTVLDQAIAGFVGEIDQLLILKEFLVVLNSELQGIDFYIHISNYGFHVLENE